MTLDEYLRREGRGAKSALTRKTGLAYTTVHNIARGTSRPRVETALLIERATDGAVSAGEVLGLVEQEAA